MNITTNKSVHMINKEKITVVFCLPGRQFSGTFLKNWTELQAACHEKNIVPILSNKYSSNVYFVRSLCLGADVLAGKAQAPFQGTLDYDYIMWIDNDIIFTPEQFFKMLDTLEKDRTMHVLSGLYAMEGGTHFACVKKMETRYFKEHGSYEFMRAVPPSEDSLLIKVDYNGMGFMLVRRGVFEALEYPWFGPKYFQFEKGDNAVYDFCSEDVAFCLSAKAAGFPVWVDPSIRVGHEKTRVF
jgi:hypothetical protein